MIRVYHVTHSFNIDSIFKYGLLREKFLDNRVWLFKDMDNVNKFRRFGNKNPLIDNVVIILNVNEKKLRKGEWHLWNEYYIEENIKPNRIIGALIYNG